MKKLFAMILAALMLTGTMVSCGGGTATETDAPANNDAAAVETDAPEAAPEGQPEAAPETEAPKDEYVYTPDPANQYTGAVGVSQYGTSVSYESIKVVNNADRKTLLDLSFDDAADLEGFQYFTRGNWTVNAADWTVADGKLNFTNTGAQGASAWIGNTEWGNYNVTVKGIANEGIEGLGIYFGVKDENNYYYFNLGGWSNTLACVEWKLDGQTGNTDQIPISLKYGQEYTISVNVGKDVVRGYLNGEQLFQIGGEASETIHQGAVGFATWSTANYFDNLKVTDFKTGEVLYENDFSTEEKFNELHHDLPNYSGGSWSGDTSVIVWEDGMVNVTDSSSTAISSWVGDPTWRNYVYTIDFQPYAGAEGANIFFNVKPDVPSWSMMNLGGWSNTKAAFQWYNAGSDSSAEGDAPEFATTHGEWHTAQLVVLDYAVFVYVNGEYITSYWN